MNSSHLSLYTKFLDCSWWVISCKCPLRSVITARKGRHYQKKIAWHWESELWHSDACYFYDSTALQSPRQSDKHSKSRERFMRGSWLRCRVSARSTIWADWEMNRSIGWGENNTWFLQTDSTDIKAFWDLVERLVCISALQGVHTEGTLRAFVFAAAVKHFPQFCGVL